MTKVIVTGASGFIGGHLVPQLRLSGYRVVKMDSSNGDVADEATWKRLEPAEVVIHLAGKTFVPDSWADPSLFIRCNLLGTVQALAYCKEHNARLVFLSSYLYGNPTELPIRESAPLVANNPYALSKKLAEEACRFYAEAFGVRVTVLRPFNVYGPGQSENFLIPWILRQASHSGAISVKDLEPRRDYVYVTDLVAAIAKAVARESSFEVVNIGTGVSYSVEELIRIIQEVKGTALPVISGAERRKDEVMDTVADISKAGRLLGWRPEVSLREGIKRLLAAG